MRGVADQRQPVRNDRRQLQQLQRKSGAPAVIDSNAPSACLPRAATRSARSIAGRASSSRARGSGADQTMRYPAPGQRQPGQYRRRRRETIAAHDHGALARSRNWRPPPSVRRAAAPPRCPPPRVSSERSAIGARPRGGPTMPCHPRLGERLHAASNRQRFDRIAERAIATPADRAMADERRPQCALLDDPRERTLAQVIGGEIEQRTARHPRRTSTRSAQSARGGSACHAPSARRNAALPGLMA